MARLPVELMTLGNRDDLPTGQMRVDRAGPEDFGGGVAVAIGGVANGLSQLGAAMQANAKQVKQFDTQIAVTRLKEADNVDYEESKRQLTGLETDFWQKTREKTSNRWDTLLNSITDPVERKRLEAERATWLGARTQQAVKDQYEKQNTSIMLFLSEEQKKAGQQVQNDPKLYRQFLTDMTRLVDASPLEATEKIRQKQLLNNQLALIAATADAKTNPSAVIGEPVGPAAPTPGVPQRPGTGMSPEDATTSPGAPATPAPGAPVSKRKIPSFAPAVNSAIDRAAQQAGIRPDAMRLIADIESSGNPAAQNKGSKYSGLFQTSRELMQKYVPGGDIYNADDNALAAARNMKEEATKFAKKYNRPMTITDLYMLHQQGPAGFPAHLANPGGSAVDNVRRFHGRDAEAAIWKNIPTTYRSRFPGGVQTVSSEEFMQVWRDRLGDTGAPIDGGPAQPGAPRAADTVQRPPYWDALTPQQRTAVTEAATVQQQRDQQQVKMVQEAEHKARINTLLQSVDNGPSPQAAFQEAVNTGLLSNFSDLERARNVMKARTEREGDITTFSTVMAAPGSTPMNPFDAKNRKAMDAGYTDAVKRGLDPNAVGGVVFEKTGIVTPSYATHLRGQLASSDPKTVLSGMTTLDTLMRANPNALAGVENRADIEKRMSDYQHQVSVLGKSSEEAVRNIMETARNPVQADPLKDAQITEFNKTYLTADAVRLRVQKAVKDGGWGLPDLPPDGEHATALTNVYGELAREAFRTERNPDKALDLASMWFKQRVGVQNGVVTMYPPNKVGLPALPETGHAWVNEQGAWEASKFKGEQFEPGNVFLVPHGRETETVARTGQPVMARRDRPGMDETFASVPYRVVAKSSKPGATWEVLPGVFYPDLDAYVADKNAKNAVPVVDPLTSGGDILGPAPMQPPAPLLTPKQAQEKKAREADTATATERETRKLSVEERNAEASRLRQRLDALPEGDLRRGPLDARLQTLDAMNKRDRR